MTETRNNKMPFDQKQLRFLKDNYRRLINARKTSIKNELGICKKTFKPAANADGLFNEQDGTKDVEQNSLKKGDRSASYFKEHFNKFFRDDLYGKYASEENIILSTGSLDQNEFSLPDSLKYAVDFAMANNWYGYSCSLGRESARQAIADLENLKIGQEIFRSANIALVSGVTSGLSNIMSFLKDNFFAEENCTILSHMPTYMPFATSCESIAPTRYVDFTGEGSIDIDKMIKQIDRTTRIVLLLADFNPIGKLFTVEEINRLSDYCKANRVYLIVDEAGAKYPEMNLTGLKENEFLIRIDSLSKKLSIPGMKLGYFVADKKLIESYYEKASTCYGGPASFFYLLQEIDSRFSAFMKNGDKKLDSEHLSLFDPNYCLDLAWLQFLYDDYVRNISYIDEKIGIQRKFIVDSLLGCKPGLVEDVRIPETGVNVFVRIKTDLSSYDFFKQLLLSKKIAVFPGICSGVENGCWVRITAGVSREQLETGVAGLISFLKESYISDCMKRIPEKAYGLRMP